MYNRFFSYFSTKTYVVGTQKNCLNEAVLEHPKHMLKNMGKKIFTVLVTLFVFVKLNLCFQYVMFC